MALLRTALGRVLNVMLVAVAVAMVGCSVQGSGGPATDNAGASSSSYTLEGTITGLSSAGLVLANGTDTIAVAANATSFTLAHSVASASSYAVTVATQPSGLTCSVVNGAGTMPASNVTSIVVTCLENAYSLGGGVTGLNRTGLVLTYGSGSFAVPVNATSFTLLESFAPGSQYAVTVASQPSGLNCSLANGTGTMPAADVTNIAVTCSANTYSLSGSITGLTSAGLVLANNGVALQVVSGASGFSFGAVLRAGAQYSVIVQSAPSGLTCSVTNGSGTAGAANVANVLVSCANQTAGATAGQVYQCNDSGAAGRIAVDTNSLGLTVNMPDCTNMVAVSLADATLTLQRWHPGDLTDPNAIWQPLSSLPAGWSVWTPNGWETLSQIQSGMMPPSVPTGLVATPQSSSTIQLTWNAATDSSGVAIGGYTIYRNGKAVGTTASASYMDAGLIASTLYSYDVAAYDVNAVASAESLPATATTLAQAGSAGEVYQCDDTGAAGRVAVDTNSLGLTVTMPNCTNMVAIPLASATLTLQRWHPGDLTDPNAIWQSPSLLPTGWSMWTPNGWETLAQIQSGTVPTPPTVPTGLVAAAESGTTVLLTWNASTDSGGPGVEGYTVYRNGTAAATTSSTSYTDVGLTASTQYNYTVAAYDLNSDASAQSSSASATTLPDSAATGQVYQCNDVGAAGRIAVDANSLGLPVTMPDCTNMVAVPLASATLTLQRWHPGDLTDPNAIWQAASILPTGWSMWTPYGWETLAQIQGGATPTLPTVPAGLVATATGNSSIALTWTASTDSGGPGLAGYTVYREGSSVGTTTSASYTDTGLAAGTKYTYTVAAYDSNSNASAQSMPAYATTTGGGTSGSQNWVWVGGSATRYSIGVYGVSGVAASANVPGSRYQAGTWTDPLDNLWLFGGWGGDATNNESRLNDIWMYNPGSQQWTWEGGSNLGNAYPNWGTQGVAAPTNTPGGRDTFAWWSDSAGNFYMFGGDTLGVEWVLCNDMWKYDITTHLWTWLNGPTSCSLGPTPITSASYTWETTTANLSVFGTQGVPAAGNIPANRRAAASWTDASGNLWLFGGISYVNYGPYTNAGVPEGFVYLNDLWMYNPATNLWTWMGGSQSPNSPGVYGTQGVGSTSNMPSAREVLSGTTWADKAGNLWLFGGVSPSSGLPGGNNDLWKYNIASGEWTWVSGSNSSGGTGAGPSGVYGSQGVAAAGNVPGARYLSHTWIDASNNLWMWGGGQWQGYDGEAPNGFTVNYDDLWKFVPATGLWTWVNGTQNTQVAGSCGTQGVSASSNLPGARNSGLTWIDSAGSLWLFGGEGLDCSGNQGLLGDLWKY